MDRAVVLLSGGMDSVTLLHYVRRQLGVPDLFALSLAYGQTHVREIEEATWQAAALGAAGHEIVDMSFFGRLVAAGTALTGKGQDVPDLCELDASQCRQPPTYVPHRNLLFLSLAGGYAEAVGAADVFFGAQAQDRYGYWDCTTEFVTRLNRVLGLNRGRQVRVHAPFADKGKSEVLKIGLALGVDYSHTWTCYRGGRSPCGTCPSCVERAAAFRAAGVEDPLVRAVPEPSPDGLRDE